jgi:hypothetical protein
VEVVYGQKCQDSYFGNFPVFHVVIHTLEQIGIYLYGVGVAGIEHLIVNKTGGARIQFLGFLPYLAITASVEKLTKSE